METQNIAYPAKSRLQRTRYFMGGYWTFLATGADTDGQFALIELNLRKGLEPPAHTHTYEDESFYVVEGEIAFKCGDEEHNLKAGDFIFLPKGIPHEFKLKSDKVKMQSYICPAGLEEFFMEISMPADKMDYPPMPTAPPNPEWLKKLVALQQEYGIIGLDNDSLKAS